MNDLMWSTCLFLSCIVLSTFCGNYSYYEGFAYKTSNTTALNPTINSCVCSCLLTNGCTALTYYNDSNICSLVYDKTLTGNNVAINSTATLLIVSANISYTP
ncbi:unnamed protein product [Rotaria magnacalcarata]|uniref:Apple domain-containing protein n=1 Tax=Rotaria magnacalcarata TaxID=392030 RepID=A0A816YPC7_9BILA|nr:unnamed protein product [Rotaria magnacalcarata]CAF1685233.1 unnamed protein product [Rotaria magnacalcarata]CAF2014315.1 unnamed protein product [Rotaria magnacalcarata]CAF2163107.1 unnamed protein product [Rotaria magnacalcarata]CAF2167409.1 unnamed protein product [Rotaria magnacalcarata]